MTKAERQLAHTIELLARDADCQKILLWILLLHLA